MSKTKLGFVFLPASEVIDLSKAVIARIQARKAERAEEMIQNQMAPRKNLWDRFWFGKAVATREEAIERIKKDDLLAWDFWYYQPEYTTNQHEALQKMINVATALLGSGNATMQVTIEAANWLYPDVE